MQKKSIVELLAEAKEIRKQEAELKARMKESKKTLAVEYQDNLSAEEKQKQIAEAEKILNTAKAKAISLREEFKKAMKQIRNDVAFAKEILAFVNYKQNNSLPKEKNSFVIEKSLLKFNREGIKEILVDTAKANWKQIFKEELRKQGINGENRVADNIIYKATQLLATHTAQ